VKRRFSEFIHRSHSRRRVTSVLMCVLLGAFAALALIPLLSVFAYALVQGLPALDWSFFTRLPQPVGETGGGMANALLGTATLVGLASAVGVPWGMATGIYLSEYGRDRASQAIRFAIDLLASVPSIIVGLFVYAAVVIPMKRFSALAGGIALGMLMVPTVARTTEEMLKLVPSHIREAGLALGLPRRKVILRVVVRGSLGAILTGVMLAIARVAGETAPLLFTAFGNRFWQRGLDQPIASLPVQIYTYAISPYDEWRRQAWAGALVLILFVVGVNLITRAALSRRLASGGAHE
jgi:phosphate transport system permease protein